MCDAPLPTAARTGPALTYCSSRCRQAHYRWRRAGRPRPGLSYVRAPGPEPR